MGKNYYDILGVSHDASEKDIKKAYKKAAVKWHPDKWANSSDSEKKTAEEKFKEINEAYACLSDSEKKQHYDRFGSMEGFGSGMDSGFNGFTEDFFNNIFNRYTTNRNDYNQRRKASTVKLNMGITIEEIFNGINRDIQFTTIKRCHTCHGKQGENRKACPHCNGTGKIVHTQQTPFGYINNVSTCPDCNGTGYIFDNVCKTCHGEGVENVQETLHINVKGPIIPGASKIYYGKGIQDKDTDIEDGDIYIRFMPNIDENKYFIGDDNATVYEMLEVDIVDCLLGCKKQVKHPSGITYEIKIPECCKDNHKLALRGKGITSNSDYIYVIKYKTPEVLTEKQKQLLIDFKK